MLIDKYDFDYMRDCVREALINGCESGRKFVKMRHAIIVEMKRLDHDDSVIKDVLVDWNDRLDRPLGYGDQKRQLLGYVDWVAKKQKKRDCKIGCNALSDYCLGKEQCSFLQRVTQVKRETAAVLPFDMDELEKYLAERFDAEGRTMMLIVRSLRRHQEENVTGEIMFISYRKLCSRVRDIYNVMLYPMDVLRIVKKLEDEGVLKTVEKGKQGSASFKANAYRFLPWPGTKNP